jgi:hypothetical protein
MEIGKIVGWGQQLRNREHKRGEQRMTKRRRIAQKNLMKRKPSGLKRCPENTAS